MRYLASQSHRMNSLVLDDDQDGSTRVVFPPAPELTLRDFLSRVWEQSSHLGEEWLDQPLALSLRDCSGRTHAGRLASASVDRIPRGRRSALHPTVVLSVTLSAQPGPSPGAGSDRDRLVVPTGPFPREDAGVGDERSSEGDLSSASPDSVRDADPTDRVHLSRVPWCPEDAGVDVNVEVADVEVTEAQVLEVREVDVDGDRVVAALHAARVTSPRYLETLVGQTPEQLRWPGPVAASVDLPRGRYSERRPVSRRRDTR